MTSNSHTILFTLSRKLLLTISINAMSGNTIITVIKINSCSFLELVINGKTLVMVSGSRSRQGLNVKTFFLKCKRCEVLV